MTDCFRRCVAYILNIPLEDVPAACDSVTWDWKAFQNWLLTRGLQAIEIELDHELKIGGCKTAVPCIVSGNSPRGVGLHAVVGTWKKELCLDYDPHPDQTFIVGKPTSILFLVKL